MADSQPSSVGGAPEDHHQHHQHRQHHQGGGLKKTVRVERPGGGRLAEEEDTTTTPPPPPPLLRFDDKKPSDGKEEEDDGGGGGGGGGQRSLSDLSLVRFIRTELTRGYFLEHNEAKYTERREKVYTCLRIPKELEKTNVCKDAYGSRRLLQPAQVCDVLKGFIMVLCYSMMSYVDYSMMYHLIRGQSVIKLYIIYNMLEVADRLFSSFGQDILDALYWTATEPKEKKRAHIGVIPHFLMGVTYVFLHALLIMVQATTLNVAFNSHNKSLLTIMMSNNFVEIKGSVFKKFEKNNLFQMSNSDHLWVLFPDVFMVIASEVAVDIVKHAFITKFNDISADVYGEYRASLAFDLVSSRQKNAYTDYSDSVSRRMGFIPLPLALLLIKVVSSSVKVQGSLSYMCVLLFYLGMITLKVLNSIVLLGTSCAFVKQANMEEKLFDPPPSISSSRVNSRAHRPKHPHTAPPQDLAAEKAGAAPTADPSQPTSHPSEGPAPSMPTSPSDTFLTTPDGEDEEDERHKVINTDTGLEEEVLKHRTHKKDLLEIDRFTICGNRID
ncbi:hypothetical protein CRUP_032165 [Coryphaenoides rupestris]|nr:hypothetical protein CRUP_032165 [Coryphaenoides rupestris]